MATFGVRLTPRGGADRIEGVGAAGELRVRVRPPAADGRANAALIEAISDALNVPAFAVQIASGAASRTKVIRVTGLDPVALRERWPGLVVRETGGRTVGGG